MKNKASGWRTQKQEAKPRPTIITVDQTGEERNWGPLSKANAWRAGSYLEDLDGGIQIFLEKDGTRMEVQVEKRINGEKEWFWLREKNQQPQTELRGERDDLPIPEEVEHMQEDTPEERQSEQLVGLAERVTSLEKENGELKKALQEMQAKAAGHTEAIRATCERFSMIETGLLEISNVSGNRRPSTKV